MGEHSEIGMQGDVMAEAVGVVTAHKPPKPKKKNLKAKPPNGLKARSPNGVRKLNSLDSYREELQRERNDDKRFDESAYMPWLTPLGSDTKDYWSEYQTKYGGEKGVQDTAGRSTGATSSQSKSSRLDRLCQPFSESQSSFLSFDHWRQLETKSKRDGANGSSREHSAERQSLKKDKSSRTNSGRSLRDYMSLDDNSLLLGRSLDLSDFKSSTGATTLHKSSSFESNTQLLSKQLRATGRSGSNRRSRSDLGFLTASHERLAHTPRTAALLNNPAFRKHLARSVGHNPDDVDLVDSVDKKFKEHLGCLSVKLQSDQEENNNKLRSNPLRCSASDIFLSRHLRSKKNGDSEDEDEVFQDTGQETGVDLNLTFPLATSSRSKRHVSSGDLESELLHESGDPDISQSESRLREPRSSVPSLDVDSLRKLDTGAKEQRTDSKPAQDSANKFHIPTFGEFKRLRNSGQMPFGRRPLSFSFDFTSVGTIQEEEDVSSSQKSNEVKVKGKVKPEEVKRSYSCNRLQSQGADTTTPDDDPINSIISQSHKTKSAKPDSATSSDLQNSRAENTNKSSPPEELVIDLTAWDFNVNMTSDETLGSGVKPKAKVTETEPAPQHCDTENKVRTVVETSAVSSEKTSSCENVPDDTPIPLPRRRRRQGVTQKPEITDASATQKDASSSKDEKVYNEDIANNKKTSHGSTPSKKQQQHHHHIDKEREKLLEERRRKCSGQASREEIISFLQTVKTRGLDTLHSSTASLASLDSCGEERMARRKGRSGNRRTKRKEVSSGAEVERVDSGVGSETTSQKKLQGPTCEDCDRSLREEGPPGAAMPEESNVCHRCASRRTERKDTIQEIVNTEVSYGKDLKIIREEFYLPMKTAGLLNAEQLQTIFINMEELISISSHFTDQLQDALDIANEQGDEDYMTVHVGKLFLQSSNMLLAFETYCVNQSAAPILLDQLEKDKELLRIFLHVSQTENSVLRRMSLKSFLVVPVQRIMKYPLLLSRLHKLTPIHHEDRESIRKAQLKIEDILELINSKAKDSMSVGMRRKFTSLRNSQSQRLPSVASENIELHKVAMSVLGWNRHDINFLRTGRMLFSQPAHLWAKKSKTLKFQPVHLVLTTLGRSTEEDTDRLHFYKQDAGIKEAAVIIVKEKAGKYHLLRDPLYLSKCVVAVDPDCAEIFEILDISKESFLFKGEDIDDTDSWCRLLKLQAKDLGGWRRRRNAFANIMIQNMARS